MSPDGEEADAAWQRTAAIERELKGWPPARPEPLEADDDDAKLEDLTADKRGVAAVWDAAAAVALEPDGPAAQQPPPAAEPAAAAPTNGRPTAADEGPPPASSEATSDRAPKPYVTPPLHDHDRRHLRGSGLTDAMIAEYRLYTETSTKMIARRLGRRGEGSLRTRIIAPKKLGPAPSPEALCFPVWLPHAAQDSWPCSHRYRLWYPTPSYKGGKPERDDDGNYRPAKYLTPTRLADDDPPAPVYFAAPLGQSRLELLRDPSVPLYFTEGEKKALVLAQCGLTCVGLVGIWMFGDADKRSHNKKEHPHAKRFFWHRYIEPYVEHFRGRGCTIVFDHYADKDEPQEPLAAAMLAHLLHMAGATVSFIVPPSAELKGIDDYYAHHARRGNAAPDLLVDAARAYDLAAGKAAVLALLEQAKVLPRTAAKRADAQPAGRTEQPPPHAAETDDDENDSGLPKLGLDTLPKGVESETGLAQAHRLARFFGRDMRHDSTHGWMVWDGMVWRRDATAAMNRAMILSRAILVHARKRLREAEKELKEETDAEAKKELEAETKKLAGILGWAAGQQERNALANVLDLASNLAPIATTPQAWDRDILGLNCTNGTVDLRTGELRPHRREDMLTKRIELAYDPHASAPLFEAFLAEVQPDADVRAYLQRVAGYSAVGVVREHVLVVLWGPGSNGKSVFAGSISSALGPYARAGADSLITRTGEHEPHPADVAACFGARLVVVHETRQGAAFDASKIKKLTGGDTLTAHHMRQDWFDFSPTHTLVMLSNYKPHGDASDAALWRRIHLVPWDVTIPPERVDTTLSERLRLEAQGVLAWVVRGAVEWHGGGLAPPKKIVDQTAAYRATEDLIKQFVSDSCEITEHAQCRGGELYGAYRRWCEANGLRPRSNNDFSAELRRQGFEREQKASGAWYRGIQLAPPPPPEEPES